MKKITLLLCGLVFFTGFSQQKTSGTVNLHANMTANFTLDNSMSLVTLVLTGPSDRWFGLGLDVVSGFGMGNGDVLVYSNSFADRHFAGIGTPPSDTAQDWTVVSNTINGMIRTLILTRNLTNSDSTGQDFQMPYATINSFSIVGVRSGSANVNIGSHGGSASAGYQTVVLTTLGTEDLSLKASSIYPNPSNGTFRIQTKTALTKVKVYGQTGNFIKTIDVKDNSQDLEINLKGVATGIYLLELQNKTEKSWKKVIVN